MRRILFAFVFGIAASGCFLPSVRAETPPAPPAPLPPSGQASQTIRFYGGKVEGGSLWVCQVGQDMKETLCVPFKEFMTELEKGQ